MDDISKTTNIVNEIMNNANNYINNNDNDDMNTVDNEYIKIKNVNDKLIETMVDKIVDKLQYKIQDKLNINPNKNTNKQTQSDIFNNMITKESGAEHIPYEEQIDALKTSIWKNMYFYIIALFCCIVLANVEINKGDSLYKKGYLYSRSIASLGFAMLAGHTIHWLSHHVNCRDYLDSCDNIITNNKYIRSILNIYADIIDFHDTTHHDSSVNKKWYNIFYEFMNNLLTQSVLIVWLIQQLDFKVILLWGLMYATVHNINYLIIKPTTHMQHHVKSTTNYGIDVTDILFNTKYNWKYIESHNHAGINLLIITAIIAGVYTFTDDFKLFSKF
jgi:hypothetical protein